MNDTLYIDDNLKMHVIDLQYRFSNYTMDFHKEKMLGTFEQIDRRLITFLSGTVEDRFSLLWVSTVGPELGPK